MRVGRQYSVHISPFWRAENGGHVDAGVVSEVGVALLLAMEVKWLDILLLIFVCVGVVVAIVVSRVVVGSSIAEHSCCRSRLFNGSSTPSPSL